MQQQKRDFLIKTAASVAAVFAMAGCTTALTTTPGSANNTGDNSVESKHRQINTAADGTIERLRKTVPGSSEVLAKANGVLVFPSVIAAGLGIGGEYGQGVLRVRGANAGYYSLGSLSIGLQAGAQSKAVVFVFMTQDALDKFRASKGWSVGADASVAVLKAGANGTIDSTAGGPVQAFVLTNAGLMANLALEGTKITPLKQ